MRAKTMSAGLLAGAAGTILFVLGVFLDREQAAYAYLLGYFYAFSLVVGSLFVLMVGHASHATWFVPLRRSLEMVVGAMPMLGLLWLPLLFFHQELYAWTRPHELPEMIHHHVSKKAVWLDSSFFTVRSILYLVVFAGLAELLRRWSLRQDGARDQSHSIVLRRRMARLSVGGLVVAGFAVTLLSWDWLMSLEPAWFSDLYGVYVFSGSFLAALGLFGVLSVGAHWLSFYPRELAAEHWHAIGRLQLGFVIFWTYIGWAHVLQHWIANIPAEHLWYIRRWAGGWEWFGVVLIVSHWLLPFLVLLSRDLKRRAASFFAISAYLVVVHLLDIYYLIVPAFTEGQLIASWMSLAVVLAVAGWCLFFVGLRASKIGAFPKQDPLFVEGMAYESES